MNALWASEMMERTALSHYSAWNESRPSGSGRLRTRPTSCRAIACLTPPLAEAKANLDRWSQQNADVPSLLRCYTEWGEILQRPSEDICEVLCARTEEGQRLRQNSPFAGCALSRRSLGSQIVPAPCNDTSLNPSSVPPLASRARSNLSSLAAKPSSASFHRRPVNCSCPLRRISSPCATRRTAT